MIKADSLKLGHTSIHQFRAPKSLVLRFISKKVRRTSIIFGAVIGLYMVSKASSYITAYPTEAAREKIAVALGNNVSVQAMLGVAHHIDKVNGYMAWNFLCLVAAAGAIWGLLLATKLLRGEEDNGRWELLISGQTSARKATKNALIGMASGLAIVYLLLIVFLLVISKLHGADFNHGAIYFFALSLLAGAAEFMAVGALTSQLMPARSRATGLAVAVFGVFYAIRAVADTTTAHWLLNLSPLGWIEKLQPMYGSQPIWLLPIGAFIALCVGLAIYFAGKRDLDEGIFAEKENIKPNYALLKGPLSATIRLTRANTIGWLLSISFLAFGYGQLAKSSIINTLTQSKKAEKAINQDLKALAHTAASKTITVTDFLAVAFFLIMLIIMFYAANSIGQARSDEARGYLDNFVVRPVSRVRWLISRIILTLSVIALSGLLASILFWVSQIGQHNNIYYSELFKAGINAVVPAVLILGIGVFIYGILPRLTSVFAYGAIAWSFLILMLGSGLKFNHWLLDTSILHHINFAPAVAVDWKADGFIVGIGFLLMIVGILAFRNRDLAGD